METNLPSPSHYRWAHGEQGGEGAWERLAAVSKWAGGKPITGMKEGEDIIAPNLVPVGTKAVLPTSAHISRDLFHNTAQMCGMKASRGIVLWSWIHG